MFEMKFKVVEIRESGATITHYLKGNKKAVKKTLKHLKRIVRNMKLSGKKEW